ncbi:hypothetical protein [Stakelama tenebrarum]|uniref:Aminoglycoside phosphotransferase domain-containing protein n=1 Tax=Stakelama tenebrarum TaxID=2711215 RepID=A0A6G6Y796_9SPHN|nr:hypothetical protein [Sphingosinithalassobacter tenebrarum]QIG80795.1 hypothetical protein G5C33_14025 [Sphingosinithalassobacter tenebrarum]
MGQIPIIDAVRGDRHGLEFPAHIAALRAAGIDFLTAAFRAEGILDADNRVRAITEFAECPGGSTGRKLFLSVAYDRPQPGLPERLFAKFSRDFDDPVRDSGKDQMESEVLLAAMSHSPDFPIAVPRALFADYHRESGTGLLITDRIAFGRGDIEPHYDKCLDWRMADPLEHYRALVTAIARIAGAHRAGDLDADIVSQFPFDPGRAAAGDPIRYDARRLGNRIARFADFAGRYPHLFPEAIRHPDFITRLEREVPRVLEQEGAIKARLHAHSDLIALTHWNANVDNGWFWRDEAGQLHCGLMDWGRVGQMNVALALWGALSAAEPEMLAEHLDDLLTLFTAEYRAAGGPRVDPVLLGLHFDMFVATMGLAWLMDAPPMIAARIPDLEAASGPHDPRFQRDEVARTQLYMSANFLGLWERRDFGPSMEKLLAL